MGIFGYSDDNFLVAPSLDSLQEMLETCQNYAMEHGLKFSTNVNPTKCKTKCIAFLFRDKILEPAVLCGDPLPWVQGGVHLGNHIKNTSDGMGQDIRVKRANFISKNIELNQEFDFSHPLTKVKLNLIYNFHFTGSPLWDLFSREAVMIENSWNTAVRVMFDLPQDTHRYFIEPISETRHLKFVLIDRFLNFLTQIEKLTKQVPKQLLKFIKRDARSTTGSNLRNILLLTGKDTIDDILRDDTKALKYHECEPENQWKIKMLTELIDVKNNKLTVEGFKHDELDEMVTFLCSV